MAKKKKRKYTRAPIVRRKNKVGNNYYYNKKTKKIASKSSWYKYRTWVGRQKEAPKVTTIKVPKKKEIVRINLESPLYKIDIDKSNEKELRKEKNRLGLSQVRLRNRGRELKLKKNKKKVGAQLRRYARHIQNIQKKLGEYKKPKGFKKESYTIGDNVFVDNVYKWDAKKFVDDLIESGDYDIFIIQGIEYGIDDPITIGLAVDDLETEADMQNIYYFTITQNIKTRTVRVTLSQA